MWITSKLSALHSSLFDLLRLRYSIDRPYERKSLTYAAYGFMLVVVCILIPVNYALQGYGTITTYKQNPNTTNVHWYHTFTGKPKPGSRCEGHVFSLGDTFQTSIGTLSYTLQSVRYNSSDGISNWGGTTIPYKGLSTDFCDVTYLNLGLSPAIGSVVETATIQCIHKDFQVNATTTIEFNDFINALPSSPLYYLAYALQDLAATIWGFPQPTGVSVGNITIGTTEPVSWFCPMFLIKNETNIDTGAIDLNTTSVNFCTPRQYDEPALSMATPGIMASDNSSRLNTSFQNALNNHMEVLASIVRYDLGSRLPGNFLVNPFAVLSQNTFLPSIPEFNLTTAIQDAIGVFLPLAQPFNASAPNQPPLPTLSTTYECRLTVPKNAGSAAVSVTVATITIGATIWKLLMLAVAYIAKENERDANHCEHHSLEEGLPKSLNVSEEHLELQERSDLRQNTSHDHLESDE